MNKLYEKNGEMVFNHVFHPDNAEFHLDFMSKLEVLNIDCIQLDLIFHTCFDNYLFEPLNSWSFYESVPRIKSNASRTFRNETVIIILSEMDDIDHTAYDLADLTTFNVWTALGESSLLIRRIFNEQDIDLMGRFMEWLWASS